MARRYLTIVARQGKTVITDSKKNKNGNGTYYEYGQLGDNTQLSILKALNSKLSEIPRNIKFKDPISFLLPSTISFLAYQDTRNIWCGGVKKSGEKISPEIQQEVQILDRQLAELENSNVELYSQNMIMSKEFKSFVFKNQVAASWKLMNELVPKQEVAENVESN